MRNRRWINAHILNKPEYYRRIAFSGNALPFFNKIGNISYITDSVKARTEFVGFISGDSNRYGKPLLMSNDLSMYEVSNLGSQTVVLAYLIHMLKCDNCKKQLMMIDDILICNKCNEIK